MRLKWYSLAVCCALGCAGNRGLVENAGPAPVGAPGRANLDVAIDSPWNSNLSLSQRSAMVASRKRDRTRLSVQSSQSIVEAAPVQTSPIQPVAHEAKPAVAALQEGQLTINGKTYRVQLVEDEPKAEGTVKLAGGADLRPIEELPPLPGPIVEEDYPREMTPEPCPLPHHRDNVITMNLPTALSMIGGQHPAVGFAQWRVQEAYARLEQANVLWLPSIQPGFSFHKHDGNYQASDGTIVDVNRNSFQYGLGAGATGAGTTPRPGIVAQFELADAIFQPDVARKTAWARGHAANGVVNEQLLTVSLAYLELLNAEQDLRIVEESLARTGTLSKLTSDYAATGQGLQADADRLQTEMRLVENRLAAARERADVASARLAQALSIDGCQRIVPLDPTVIPIELVSCELDKGCLIGTGLSNRPELKEAQALVSAAWDEYRRQKYSPFIPSVLLGLSTGGFGGGLGNTLGNVDDRYDFDAMLTWEVRNLGFGEGAARRQSEAQIQQAKFEKVRVLDQIAREVSEAHSQVLHRSARIGITEQAVRTAEDSYRRNLSRIRDGQGLPLEVLQSVRALEDARRAYLVAIIEYNEAQFRLQWALGWPVDVAMASMPSCPPVVVE